MIELRHFRYLVPLFKAGTSTTVAAVPPNKLKQVTEHFRAVEAEASDAATAIKEVPESELGGLFPLLGIELDPEDEEDDEEDDEYDEDGEGGGVLAAVSAFFESPTNVLAAAAVVGAVSLVCEFESGSG